MMERQSRSLLPVFYTGVYVTVFTALPWFFGHQTCRVTVRSAARFLNTLNCRMHFPGSDRTLEAYATWFAAVFASAALFWAWKAFSVQSQMLEAQLDTLREQQRGIFLSSLSKEYNKRLENAAFWIVMEVKEKFPHNTGEKLYLTSQQKLIYYFGMIIARKNVEEIREVNNSQNVRAYEAIARDYDQQIDRQRLEILKKGSMPDCAWVQVLVHIKNMESVYQAMASNF